ncbi:MAG: hypothetical protein ACE5KD_00485 [Candidatus Bathyarchaeia archaeon]
MQIIGNEKILTNEDFRPRIPKEFQWIRQVKMLQDKGYLVKFVYDGVECDIPRGELDSENQSFIPRIPDKIRVLAYKNGQGFVQVTEFEGRSRLDPSPEVAMGLWGLFGI